MNKVFALFFSFILVAALALSGPFVSSASAQGANYTADEGRILKNGQEIRLSGVNWFGAESLYHFRPYGLDIRDYQEMIAQMKSLGFTAVRFPVCPDTLKNKPVSTITFANGKNASLANLKSLDLLDVIVDEFNEQEMYVLLDMHSSDCLNLNQFWYTSNYSTQNWIDDLTFMAERYADREYVIGIDLKNEPHGPANWGLGGINDWKAAAEAAGQAVNRVNSNWLIFVEGVQNSASCSIGANHWQGGNFEPQRCRPIDNKKIPADKLVFSPHVYGPDVYTQPYMNSPEFPDNLFGIWDTHFGFLTETGATLVPGEWGGKFGEEGGSPKDLVLQQKLIEYWKARNICNSFYWAWNSNATDTGGILQPDWLTPRMAKVSALQEYFAQCQTKPSETVSTLIVEAAGTPAANIYPSFEVQVANKTVATVTNVVGNPDKSEFKKFELKLPVDLSGKKVKLAFINDFGAAGQDRNLRINNITFNGKVYEAEGTTVYSQGSWRGVDGCAGKFAQSEWLHCNGYLEFAIDASPLATPSPTPIASPSASPTASPSATPRPTPSSSPSPATSSGSLIRIKAAGTPAQGVYPSVSLRLAGQEVAIFSNIRGNPLTRSFQEFSYMAIASATIDQLSLHFINDLGTSTEDRNVAIDSVSIDNQLYETEVNTVYSEGSWSGMNACGGKFAQSEWLHCAGFFQFGLAPSSQLSIHAAGTSSQGEFPSLQVKKNNQVLAEFKQIDGDANQRQFKTYTLALLKPVTISELEFVYDNDSADANEDRNLLVDKVVLDGTEYQTESAAVFSEGSWSSATGCNAKFATSEWLHCAGYLKFAN